ncbi:hypothetical protein [Streptomyces sp. NPDC051640]|uniref:hypothetical protein n=1 Tax=Streptomyces sp. NPDC051640 TaxID=3365664 RepID=UPI0037BCDB67
MPRQHHRARHRRGKLYLCAIKEAFSNRIVGYSIDERMKSRVAAATREELRIAIVTWIERTYHRRRREASLGRLTPIEFETVMITPALQVA